MSTFTRLPTRRAKSGDRSPNRQSSVRHRRCVSARAERAFGRCNVYLPHIPVIHATALLVWRVRNGDVHPEWFASAPFVSVPGERAWSLPLLYVVFALVILMLYFPCRWFEGFKARHSGSWVKYI